MPRAARPAHDRCPLGVTGGKTASEYMFSELPQLGDIVRSAFDHLENRAGITDHGVLGAITTPIVFLGKMTIAPRLVLQAIRLVGIDRGRISVPFTTRWHRFASLPALLLQPRTVIAPIALVVGAMITPRLILQSPSVFRVDDRIECPHHRLQAVGRGGVSDSDRDGTSLIPQSINI